MLHKILLSHLINNGPLYPTLHHSSNHVTQAMVLSDSDERRHVQVLEERVGATANSEFPGHYVGEDHSWNLATFQENLSLPLNRLTPTTLEFDLIGVDSSIANALRRILIAEVPTVAIESVYSYANSSIMQDEVLAHRLGLVPIRVDPRKMKYRGSMGEDGKRETNDENTLVFHLVLDCIRNPDPTIAHTETDPLKLFEHSSVYSGDLTWVPQGNQITKFHIKPFPGSKEEEELKELKREVREGALAVLGGGVGAGSSSTTTTTTTATKKSKKAKGKQPDPNSNSNSMDVDQTEEQRILIEHLGFDLDDENLDHEGKEWDPAPAPVDDDILLVKLRPGQKLNLLLYCIKSNGKDHAKFSPVATASYRLLPHIKILQQPPPHLIEKFVECFPKGVIEVEYDSATGQNQVVVANPRRDTVTREVLRHDDLKDCVQLSRIRDHFIFSIESTGAYTPEDLLPEAIKVMQTKITNIEQALKAKYPSHKPGYVPSNSISE